MAGRCRGPGTTYPGRMRPIAVYSVLRIALFGAAFAGFWALGAGPLVAALLAAMVSFALAFVLLRRQRDDVTRWIVDRRAARAGEASGAPGSSAAPVQGGASPGGRRRFRDLVAEDTAAEDAETAALERDRQQRRGPA